MSINIRSYIPGFARPFLRLIRYQNERKKFVREIIIRKQQNKYLKENYNADTSHLIVFLVMGSDWSTGKDNISGGILSIVSICEETRAIEKKINASTVMCTMNEEHLLSKHEKFQNNTDVYRFSQLNRYFKHLKSVLIHVPEWMAGRFRPGLTTEDKIWLSGIPFVHFNVMNQNIRLMPSPEVFAGLKSMAHRVTMTTAHSQYCNAHYRNYFGVPIHKFSVWISPEQYQFIPWRDKENLLVVSPDKHPEKEEILRQLEKLHPLQVQIINNLTYDQYKKLIAKAKWSLTFGEGLDGYLIEPVFSGAIGFAVYNEEFFTNDFKGLETIYPSYELLAAGIVNDIQSLDHPEKYGAYQEKLFNLCAKYYNKEQYRKNIMSFYEGNYTLS